MQINLRSHRQRFLVRSVDKFIYRVFGYNPLNIPLVSLGGFK